MVVVPLLVVAFQVLAVAAIYPADAGGEADEGAVAAAAADLDKRKGADEPIIVAGKGKAKEPEHAQQLQRIQSRHARPGSDESQGNAAMAFSDPQAEGAAKGPDVHLSLPGSPLWGQRHNLWWSLPGSPGGSEGSVVKDNEVCWRGKGAPDRDIEAGTSYGREEEACILQKPQRGKSQYSDQIGNHPDDKVLTQPESHSGTDEGIGAVCEPTEGVAAMRINSLVQADSHGGTNGVNLQALDGSLVQRGSLMTAERMLTVADLQALEERRHALKFSYFAAGISGAGIISIFSGYLGNQTGQLHSVHLKICTFFVLATFVSAASMVLLSLLYPSIRVSIHVFKSLKYTTLVCLSLAALYVSYLFLKVLAVIAFVPTIIILLIAFIMVIYKNRPSHSSHEIGSSNPQSFYRL